MSSRKYSAAASITALVAMFLSGCSKAPTQTNFATTEDAAKALLQALKTDDMEKLREIFGRDALDAAASGDAVADRHDRQVVALAMQQSWRWSQLGADRRELIIGDEQWPFPAPLVKTGATWKFDSDAGKEEVIARRIGRNELAMIDLCHAYVDMQKEYASQPHDGKQSGVFAQRIRSSPGRHDGLYWAIEEGQERSPLGDLVAQAEIEGYDRNKSSESPFWGYNFRILTSQGAAVAGGARSYVVNGDMSGGFAMVAFPARYGASGVMTFIVNQDGVVYEKDLGQDTANQGGRMTEYNPDETWAAVRTP
jgi:DUF2950 family protein